MFLKGFTEIQRTRLTLATCLLISSNLIPPTCLTQIINEHLVKEGIALQFAKDFFTFWLAEKDAVALINTLKKAELDNKLMVVILFNFGFHPSFILNSFRLYIMILSSIK